MSELLQAAKAVISAWDDQYRSIDMRLKNLRAAVERAERQEAVGFDEWFKRFFLRHSPIDRQILADQAWHSAVAFAQQAERERIKDVVAELLDPKDPWIHYSTLLEKIDGD